MLSKSQILYEWLDNIPRDTLTIPPRTTQLLGEFECYYTGPRDTDIIASQADEIILESDEYADIYESCEDQSLIQVSLAPHTHRYHANYLFKKLINYTIDNKLYYGKKKIPVISPKLKLLFYEFCRQNSN